MRVIPLVIPALVALAGCSQSLGALSSVSVTGAPAPAPIGPRVRGESCSSSVLGIPIGAPDLGRAARSAQRARGASTDLQDVRVSRTSWTIGVYGQECLIVDAAR